MLFKLSNLNANLALTLGYLSPALNNSAQTFLLPRTPTENIFCSMTATAEVKTFLGCSHGLQNASSQVETEGSKREYEHS